MITGIANSGYRANANKPAVTWTNQTTTGFVSTAAPPVSRNKFRLARGQKYWVLQLAEGLIYTESLANPTWTVLSGSLGGANRTITYGGGYFCHVNNNGTVAVVYDDNLNVVFDNTATPLVASYGNSVCIHYFPDSPGIKFIAGGTNSLTGYVHSSSPATSWVRSACPSGQSSTQGFAIGPATAAGNTQIVSSHGSGALFYGANGATTVPTTAWGTNPFGGTSTRAIIYANGIWVMGSDAGQIATSPGASTSPVWTLKTSPFASTDSISRIIYVPEHNMFIASNGDNGGTTTAIKTAYSTDNGNTWAIDSRTQTGSTNSVVGLYYGENGVLGRAWNNSTTTYVDWSW